MKSIPQDPIDDEVLEPSESVVIDQAMNDAISPITININLNYPMQRGDAIMVPPNVELAPELVSRAEDVTSPVTPKKAF